VSVGDFREYKRMNGALQVQQCPLKRVSLPTLAPSTGSGLSALTLPVKIK